VKNVAFVEPELCRKATGMRAERIVLGEQRPLAGRELRELLLQGPGRGRHGR
jgi:hypothetical protein